MKYKTIIVISLCVATGLVLYGCGGKKDEIVQSTGFQAPAMPEVSESTNTDTASAVKFYYKYRGDQFRDPFVPLVGETGRGAIQKRASDQMTVGGLNSLVLKGILEDNEGKFALLTDAMGGSFVVKDGKLVNQEGKIVPNVSGVIRRNKVMIISPNAKIELTIKED